MCFFSFLHSHSFSLKTENAASLARRVALTEVGDFLLVDDSMDDVEQDDFLFVEPPTEFGF